MPEKTENSQDQPGLRSLNSAAERSEPPLDGTGTFPLSASTPMEAENLWLHFSSLWMNELRDDSLLVYYQTLCSQQVGLFFN